MTPDERRTQPPVNVRIVAVEYAWPFMVMAGGVLMATVSVRGGGDAVVGLIIAVVGLVLVPIAAATTTVLLMRRMPRRTRWEPLVLLVPRMVAVPALVAMASVAVAMTVAFGACVVGVSLSG